MKSATRSVAPRTSSSVSAQQQIIRSATSDHGRTSALPPSRIALYKWTEIRNEEDAIHVINSIREEIIRTTMDIMYRDHLKFKCCSFIVDCAHIAWLQLFNVSRSVSLVATKSFTLLSGMVYFLIFFKQWMHLKRDSAASSTIVQQRWINDNEHEPIPKDNWSFGNVEILKKPITKQTDCGEPCEQQDDTLILPRNIVQSPVQISCGKARESVVPAIVSKPSQRGFSSSASQEDSEEIIVVDDSYENKDEEDEKRLANKYNVEISSSRSEASSIFSKTISAPRQELPISKWANGQKQLTTRGSESPQRKIWRSWKLDNVKAVGRLSLGRLPANRLDVKYVLVQDHASSSSPEDIWKRGTSRTFTPKSRDIKLKREKKDKISRKDKKKSEEN